MRRLAFLLLLLLPALPAAAGEMRALRIDGLLRSYYLHVPPTARSDAPLVIMLHGAGSNGQDDTVRFGWRRKAEIEGFIVAGPDASPVYAGRPVHTISNPRVWNDGAPYLTPAAKASNDVALVAGLVEELARTHRIDRRRVYVAGFSSGGNMAGRLVQEMPERLAAVMIAAGQFTPVRPKPARGVPILYFSGDSDGLNPVEGGEVSTTWGARMTKEPHRAIVERWRRLMDCPQPLLTQSELNGAEQIEIVGPCRDGSEVRYVLVKGLGHEWPVDERGLTAGTLSATNEAWSFFRRFRLPAIP
ncbi:MAG TPA: alpha/beta fold hydrolase [Reyranellaceae bacterium]|nr:alpha/beta fold hydrolase [Reyranellaceae bacterium]